MRAPIQSSSTDDASVGVKRSCDRSGCFTPRSATPQLPERSIKASTPGGAPRRCVGTFASSANSGDMMRGADCPSTRMFP